MKVAIVHDWMVSPGGGERVVQALHEIWPEAPIYTAAYDPEKFPEFADAKVRPTWLNRIELAKRKHQLFTIPRAWAFKSLNLSGYDLVISSSSAESKYVRTGSALHICYCHTPIRYYWSDYDWYRQNPPFGVLNPLAKILLPLLIEPLRRMDYRAAQKVDYYIANSKEVQGRIQKYYRRDSEVIYPPVRASSFSVSEGVGEYYLVLGRQVAYKRLDLAVDAFNELGLPLVVVGTGEEIAKQQQRANKNITFRGRVSEQELAKVIGGARALVFPQKEDFGIVPLEAMACGRPVIAFAEGGALETVVEGITGTFFKNQRPEDLVAAVRRLESMKFDPLVIRKHAEKFDQQVFQKQILGFVAEKVRST